MSGETMMLPVERAREELLQMGQALGGLAWVQGPGGNVSVKTSAGELWIKASGKRLAEIGREGTVARVSAELAVRALAGDSAADQALFACVPRPSLETYFHAFPFPVVCHTHAVGVLLGACAQEPEAWGLRGVAQIPYVRPGRGIALAMQQVLRADREEQVIVLRSHGIVVLAQSAARAVALTLETDAAVRGHVGRDLPAMESYAERYAQQENMAVEGGVVRRLPDRASLCAGSGEPRYLFPDAVVFASVIQVESLDDLAALAPRALAQSGGRAAQFVDLAGRRAVLARNAAQLAQAIEVTVAHDWVEEALGRRSAAAYLAADEPAQILGLPSEQYRIRLLGKEGAPC